jgi:hypothetical protein
MVLDLELVANTAMAGVVPQAFLIRSGTKYASCAWWNAAMGNLNSLVSYTQREYGHLETLELYLLTLTIPSKSTAS